jgi:hypothetical protein
MSKERKPKLEDEPNRSFWSTVKEWLIAIAIALTWAGALMGSIMLGIDQKIFGTVTFAVMMLTFAFFLRGPSPKKKRKKATSSQTPPPDARQSLLLDARAHMRFLGQTHPKLPDAPSEYVRKLHGHARNILKIADNPLFETTSILRFFTYYLPQTENLVNTRLRFSGQMTQMRQDEIDETLKRLVDAFAAFEATARAPELKSVELDLRLLDQALDAEFDREPVS